MTTSRTRRVVAIFILVLVLAALDQTILATALPSIVSELGGRALLSWVFSAYLLSSTVAIPLYGKLADIHGSKPMLLLAVALFLLGSLACGYSGSMNELIAARGLQGLGGGGLLTLTMLGVADLYPPDQRGRMQGLLGAAYGIAVMFGPLTGGFLVEHLSWHWAFFINVPAALLALVVLATQFKPGPARHRRQLDVLGTALLAGALVCLLLATRREPGIDVSTSGWLAAAALALGVAFVRTEQRVRDPLLPLSLFGTPAFAAAAAISMLNGVALFAAVVFLPTYLQTALHKSPTASAWHLLPLMAGITLAAMRSGKLLRSNGPVRRLARLSFVLMLLSFSALALLLRWLPGEALALSLCMLPLGAGIGLMFPLVTVVSQYSAPPQFLGIATATPIMVRALGGAVGVSLLGGLLTRQMNTGATMAGALQPMFALVALLCLLMAGLTARLPDRLSRPTMPAPATATA